MTAPRGADVRWRGWAQPGGSAAQVVTAPRLEGGAAVANRLFPKTRSWFALDSPLELLSPLSVLRILFALAAVTWPLAGLLVRWPGSNRPVLVAVIALTVVVWIGLLLVKKVDLRGCHL